MEPRARPSLNPKLLSGGRDQAEPNTQDALRRSILNIPVKKHLLHTGGIIIPTAEEEILKTAREESFIYPEK